ncbi:MAG TPA: peptide-methionine (S)-S-oxide reductase MsrA [Candidatus Acidoferrum sp.]|nr:peptide-methionine (S)-S-oxide reductase MsrA [Candidatus Acidoferrum sp.]
MKPSLIAPFAMLALIAWLPRPAAAQTETAVFAGGCFWGMEAVFERLRGVKNVVAGFTGGAAATAHYPLVSTGLTGHAESIEISYDPSQISYARLLDVFFTVAHDPTQLNRQGPDEGTQYRSAIFYRNPAQERAARAAIERLATSHRFNAPIVTQVVPLQKFYEAEHDHQHYYDRHPDAPYIVVNDVPKVKALYAQFPQLVQIVSGR